MLRHRITFKGANGWANYRKPSDVLKSNDGTRNIIRQECPQGFETNSDMPPGC